MTQQPDPDEQHALDVVLRRFDSRYPAALDVGTGWLPLIIKLDQELAELDPSYTLVQVKEKFGTLRFYFQRSEQASAGAVEKMNALVQHAEGESAKVCDLCGRPGQLTEQRMWRRTRCPQHRT